MITLKRKYEGKTFIYDGIEEVKMFRVVDADSSFFQTSSGNINIRYYGINAPEISKKIQPLGKEAREYAIKKLCSAHTIVIESEGDYPTLDNSYNRFMAYVWYKPDENSDFKLYNEEILRDGFANLLLFDNVSKYRNELLEASEYAKKNKLNLFSGNIDDSAFKITSELELKVILKDIDKYADGRTIKTSGVITGFVGKSFFIEKKFDDKVYGTYVYNTTYDVSKLKTGDLISFYAQAANDPNYGKQLVNIRGVEVLSSDNVFEISQVDTIEEILNNIGRIVRIDEIKVFQKANCNKKYNSFYLKVILPFGDSVDIKTFKDAIDAPSFASVIQYKYYNVEGGLCMFRNSIDEEPQPWLVLLNGSKQTFVKVNN